MIVWISNSRLLTQDKTKFVVMGSVIYVTLQIILFLYLGEVLGVMGLAIAVVSALSAQAAFLFGTIRKLKIGF